MDLILTFDNFILDFIQSSIRCDFLDFVMPIITLLGENGILWVIMGIVFCFFKKTRPMGISLLISLIIGLVVCNLTLKPLVARIRPYDANGFTGLLIKPLSDYSFPSGHTFASFEMGACVYAFHKKWGVFALVIATIIGFSRLYLYVHYPTDVLTGVLFGTAIGFLSSYIIKKKFTQYN